jgi:glycosyltransferase involved in cell wall biosynthesis
MRIVVEQLAPAAPDGSAGRTAVVFPAFNEQKHLREAVQTALSVGVRKVICVDDCSTDATGSIADELAENPAVVSLHHAVNRGKQAAVLTGLKRALACPGVEIVSVLDADMQNDPALLPGLCAHVPPCDAVMGRRLRTRMPPIRRLANDLADLPYRIIAALPIRDVQSGFRVYSRRAARYLRDRMAPGGRYALEHASLLLLGRLADELRRPVRIGQVPVPCAYRGRQSSIRLRDNLQLTWASVYHALLLARLRLAGGSA